MPGIIIINAENAWDYGHKIDFENGKVIDSGNYWTRKTLESWHTAIITNSDNNSKPLPKQICYACSQNLYTLITSCYLVSYFNTQLVNIFNPL